MADLADQTEQARVANEGAQDTRQAEIDQLQEEILAAQNAHTEL